MIFHGIYAYTQGSYALNEIEKMMSHDFRLELTYAIFPDGGNLENNSYVFLVTNATFVEICGEGESMNGFGRDPLYACSREWLTLFGF